jgi:hypothetical protein
MNPAHLHTIPVDATPNTPTYEQATTPGIVLPGMPGYRPPSYGSEGGLTAVLETRRRDVLGALDRVHPLHRERAR